MKRIYSHPPIAPPDSCPTTYLRIDYTLVSTMLVHILQVCADRRYPMPGSSIDRKGWQTHSTNQSISPYSKQCVRTDMIFSSIGRPINDCTHVPHSFDSDDALDGKIRLIINRQPICGRPVSLPIVSPI
jgi:hypothetical protein